jgi:hypothetical protein
MEELRNLNDLDRGIHKRWIWGTKDNYFRSCDYLQKINYSIQDLNAENKNLSTPSMKDVIFVIALVDWICEAVKSIQEILLQDVLSGFIYKEDERVKKAGKYFKAIRSFVVAHPLNTSRHKDYGLDGDLICVDVRRKISPIVSTYSKNTDWFFLGIDGFQENAKNVSADFVLCGYSQKIDRSQFSKFIGANFSDLYYVAKLQIEKLYALGKYLGKLRKKDIGWVNE